MAITKEKINALLKAYQQDAEMIEVIMDALKSFEAYHDSIYRMETRKYLYDAGIMSKHKHPEGTEPDFRNWNNLQYQIERAQLGLL